MDLKQKFIEDKLSDKEKAKCRFDDFFIDELVLLPYNVGLDIMMQIGKSSKHLPVKENWSQLVGGVTKGEDTFYFELEYIKPDKDHIIYLNIYPIDCDRYLDYINLNKYLK